MKTCGWMAAAALLLAGTAGSAKAQAVIPQDKVEVLACVENLETSTTWAQCTTMMFQPCADEEVGSGGHVACLGGQRTGWQAALETLEAKVFEAITPVAAGELKDLLGGWTKFVAQKCQQVAKDRAGTGAEAALRGCEIAEMVGLSSEYAACLEGRSTAPFCKIAE